MNGIPTRFAESLPQVADAERYEKLHPGSADRLLRIAEQQQQLSRESIEIQRRWISASTIVSLAVLALAGLAVWLDYHWLVVLPLGLSGVTIPFMRDFGKCVLQRGSRRVTPD